MDSRELKDRELRSWTAVAPGWRKNDAALREATQGVTARMLDLAQLAPGHKVLDIACGTGEPAIPAAQRVAPDGFVAGTDLVPEMIAFAREKAATLRVTNIEFRVMDAESLLLNPDSVDAVTIRWGLMFMPNPLRCL
ncbi:MAG: class I SAM-dependent methyltransferase, partial [Burkholderiales bacterium]|nr:class I SAM-dependent methyltransferase [Burkholderiales bacterium]